MEKNGAWSDQVGGISFLNLDVLQHIKRPAEVLRNNCAKRH